MKITIIGPQFPDSFARNVSVTLEAMGHEVTDMEGTSVHHHGSRLPSLWWTYAPKAFPALDRRMFRKIARTAETLQPDLVLITYGLMPPEAINALRDACDAKIVCWFTDPITSLYHHYLLASRYDTVFVKEPFLVQVLNEKLGQRVCYLPECCNPIWHRRVSLTAEDRRRYGCDLAAQGGLHYYRARMLEPFAGYDLRIWGHNLPSWLISPVRERYTNHFVSEGEKAKALGAAKIVLNTIQYSEIEGVNCTLFEAAGCGAFQIADWKPSLPELFEPEREIVTFSTLQELKEKVDYYLAHAGERQDIADRAYARAHREHTYEVRLKKMLKILGLDSSPTVDSEVVTLRTE